jgi:hypothetical protein
MRKMSVPPLPLPLGAPPHAAIRAARLIPPTVIPPAFRKARRSHCGPDGMLCGCVVSNTNASYLGHLST